MAHKLETLIERAKAYRMTPAEKDEQVRSFAYGNTHLENPAITRQDIDRAMESLKESGESSDRS